MKYQAHRGVGTEFPENTVPAFIAAAAQGYDYIELDPVFTKDGKCVILHDGTLNRTCRTFGGKELEKPVYISEISYEEALQFDAGIAKAYKFGGTKIPLLSEVVDFAEKAGISLKLDNKIQRFTAEQTEILFDIVGQTGANVGFTSNDLGYIEKVIARFPSAEIHYDGYVDEAALIKLKKILKDNELYIWLPLKSRATSWVSVPTADGELCGTVKKYGKLGLWIISSEEELREAERLCADIIETPGELKPPKKHSRGCDCHTHTHFSHDSESDPVMTLKSAGGRAIALTDHCDIEFCGEMDVKTPIMQSAASAHKLDGAYAGVEMGEAVWHRDTADDIISSERFDIVLGSVHAARYGKYTMPYSAIDFSRFSQQEITGYLDSYFDDMLEMIRTTDFDVLSHLTCPLRYICGKYSIPVDLDGFSDKTDKILREIIKRGIALEVNTSCLGTAYDSLLPDIKIVKRYKELGGYLVTLGSDAHTPGRAAFGFTDTLGKLLRLGFKNVYHYENRIPIQEDIESEI